MYNGLHLLVTKQIKQEVTIGMNAKNNEGSKKQHACRSWQHNKPQYSNKTTVIATQLDVFGWLLLLDVPVVPHKNGKILKFGNLGGEAWLRCNLAVLLCVCLSAYLSIDLPTYLPIYLTICLSICLPIWPAICLPIYLPSQLCMHGSISLPIAIKLSRYLESWSLKTNVWTETIGSHQ